MVYRNTNLSISTELFNKVTDSAAKAGCSWSHAFECLARAGAGMDQIDPPARGRTSRHRTKATARLLRALGRIARQQGLVGPAEALEVVWPGEGRFLADGFLHGQGLRAEDRSWVSHEAERFVQPPA